MDLASIKNDGNFNPPQLKSFNFPNKQAFVTIKAGIKISTYLLDLGRPLSSSALSARNHDQHPSSKALGLRYEITIKYRKKQKIDFINSYYLDA